MPKRVTGKVQLLYRIAEAVVEEPDGTIRTVLFPQVQEETFQDLAAEAKASGPQYRIWYQYVMRQKYIHHYRQMLPWVLEHLTFRSENRFQPVIEALAVIKQSLGTKGQYFPADVPVEGVVLPSWRDTVIEKHDDQVQVNRQYYELCVLQRLERALKCKEVWVEGAQTFRNPSHDMPAQWQDEGQRTAYYQVLPQPVQVTSFIDPLREQLTQALSQFNRDLPRNPYVRLTTPAANDDRRLFAVDRLQAQPEPQSLGRLKDLLSQRYGMVDLLDIFVEAERLTGFTQGSVTDSCAMTPWRQGPHVSRAIANKALPGTHRANYMDIQQVVKQSLSASMTTLDKLGPSFTRMIRISTVICYASLRLWKKKGFKEARVTTIGLYDIGTSHDPGRPRSRRRPLSATQHHPTTSLVGISWHCNEP